MMQQSWCVKIWGVRGSSPALGSNFLEYGGNTSCFSVDLGDALVVLDAGSGLMALGEQLMSKKRRRVDIFISHLHLDHVMGLFSFPLLYSRWAEIYLYGSPNTVRELAHLVEPPLWPVGLADCQAKVRLQEVRTDKPFSLARGAAPGLTVTALGGSHPGGCSYYRLDRDRRSLVYALDCELTGDAARRLTRFAGGTDLLIWDAAFAPGDLKPGWGHSTWEQGITLGQTAGAKRVLMTHYSTGYMDDFLREQEQLARQVDSRVQFAREKMVIQL